MQRAEPVGVLYFPATQFTHAPPSGPDDPALHIQLAKVPLAAGEFEFAGQTAHVSDVAPTATEYLPAVQLVHAADPVRILYVPATHSVHVPPFGPDDPALQVQLAKVPLATGELEFVGQF